MSNFEQQLAGFIHLTYSLIIFQLKILQDKSK